MFDPRKFVDVIKGAIIPQRPDTDASLALGTPEERAVVPAQLVRQDGHRALTRLMGLLENDLAPQVRESAFAQIVGLLITPVDRDDIVTSNFMRSGQHSGIAALQNALLCERDSGSLIKMLQIVKNAAEDTPALGDQFAQTLLELLRRDRFPGEMEADAVLSGQPFNNPSTHFVIYVLLPIVDNAINKPLIHEISSVAQGLMEKDGAIGDKPGPNYHSIRPLLLKLYSKKDEMGLLYPERAPFYSALPATHSDPQQPALLVEQEGHRALHRLQMMLYTDLSPETREASFGQIAYLLVEPPEKRDRYATNLMRTGLHSGLAALQDALLNERDSATLSQMAIFTKQVAQEDPRLGIELAQALLQVLRRDQLRAPHAAEFCNALSAIVDNSFNKEFVREIARQARELRDYDIPAKGRLAGPNYPAIQPLCWCLATKEEEMGLPRDM